MGNGIEVRFEYGGIRLTCDDAALARLYEYICSEASVAEVLGRVDNSWVKEVDEAIAAGS